MRDLLFSLTNKNKDLSCFPCVLFFYFVFCFLFFVFCFLFFVSFQCNTTQHNTTQHLREEKRRSHVPFVYVFCYCCKPPRLITAHTHTRTHTRTRTLSLFLLLLCPPSPIFSFPPSFSPSALPLRFCLSRSLLSSRSPRSSRSPLSYSNDTSTQYATQKINHNSWFDTNTHSLSFSLSLSLSLSLSHKHCFFISFHFHSHSYSLSNSNSNSLFLSLFLSRSLFQPTKSIQNNI